MNHRLVPALSALALLLALFLALSGCGGSDDGTAGGSPAVPSAAASGSSEPTTDVPAGPPDPTTPVTTTPVATSPTAPPSTSSDPSASATPSTPPLTGDDAPPIGDAWVAELDRLVSPDLSSMQKAGRIVDGSDLAPTIDRAMQTLNDHTASFRVLGASTKGDTGSGTVAVTLDGTRVGTVPTSFVQVDGAWRLDRDGACVLLGLAGATCPG